MHSDEMAGDPLPTASLAERMAALPPEEFEAIKAAIGPENWARLDPEWDVRGRPAQLPPESDWRLWLIQAGRGFGKTRAGAEWVDTLARAQGGLHIALVGATMHDARHVMVEGEAGLLHAARGRQRPIWKPSLGKLIWPSGSIASCYSAAEPENLRGPQFHFAWADEVGRWGLEKDGANAVKAWDNLMLALRRGKHPRVVATTTPRATTLMRKIRARRGLVVTRGRSEENRANLPDSWIDAVRADYAGTRIERQELDGDWVEDIEGALWRRELFDRHRLQQAPCDETALLRVVIGVDPPASAGGDACGIVVAAALPDQQLVVLQDASIAGQSPAGWAAAVADAAARWRPDRVVAEANNGGAMVEAVLRSADCALPVRLVHARLSKSGRAEPIALLYEQGRVAHVGAMAALEDQLCGMLSGGGYAGPGRSPDRADACIWALTELTRGGRAKEPRVRGL